MVYYDKCILYAFNRFCIRGTRAGFLHPVLRLKRTRTLNTHNTGRVSIPDEITTGITVLVRVLEPIVRP